MAKSPKRPPTISIGVISHLGRVDPTAAFPFLAVGRAEPASRGRPQRHDYSPVGKFTAMNKIRYRRAGYSAGTLRLTACNSHPNGVDDSLSTAFQQSAGLASGI